MKKLLNAILNDDKFCLQLFWLTLIWAVILLLIANPAHAVNFEGSALWERFNPFDGSTAPALGGGGGRWYTWMLFF